MQHKFKKLKQLKRYCTIIECIRCTNRINSSHQRLRPRKGWNRKTEDNQLLLGFSRTGGITYPGLK